MRELEGRRERVVIREKFRAALRKKKMALVQEQEAAVSLQTIAAAKKISTDAAVAALLSQLDGIFALKRVRGNKTQQAFFPADTISPFQESSVKH